MHFSFLVSEYEDRWLVLSFAMSQLLMESAVYLPVLWPSSFQLLFCDRNMEILVCAETELV